MHLVIDINKMKFIMLNKIKYLLVVMVFIIPRESNACGGDKELLSLGSYFNVYCGGELYELHRLENNQHVYGFGWLSEDICLWLLKIYLQE